MIKTSIIQNMSNTINQAFAVPKAFSSALFCLILARALF